MKRSHRSWLALLVFAEAFLVPAALGSSPATAEGQDDDHRLAIDFQATDLEGRPFHGLDLKGRIVLIDFWAVWCRPCIEAFPKLSRLAQELTGEDFEVSQAHS